ncbi:uncharacterized protein LOC123558849 [Mercenaria mercenaria]|uniref:uncharacterized protein LOC123558849 n=1 Tax=Mercenaria mercenaria TaxID=6596 RepID=UPI001E1DD485|nr:uncharacterized protein LOC123558849 [Mercenaria mercenaria]
MEVWKYGWTFGFMAIVCLFSNGNASPLLHDEEDRYYPDESDEPIDLQFPVFDPNSDEWNPQSEVGIESVLKRSGFKISDSYQRYPRIKEKVIIPFYSYGKNPGYYRSKPRMLGGPRVYFGYNPWNAESYRGGNRFPSSGSYRY